MVNEEITREIRDKLILKFCGDARDSNQPKQSWEKKNKVGGLMLLEFKNYYKTTVIKTMWSWHKDRRTNQWTTIQRPEINPYIYGPLIVDKGAKTTQQGKNVKSFQQMMLGQLDIYM